MLDQSVTAFWAPQAFCSRPTAHRIQEVVFHVRQRFSAVFGPFCTAPPSDFQPRAVTSAMLDLPGLPLAQKRTLKMADDLSNRGPQDRNRVNTTEPWELKYWTKTFGVTEEQLKAAVKAVGPMVADVRKKLGK